MASTDYRNNFLGSALDVILYVEKSLRLFHHFDMAYDLEMGARTAFRWLESCEARGLVVQKRGRDRRIMWARVEKTEENEATQ